MDDLFLRTKAEEIQNRYLDVLSPIFLPPMEEAISKDVVNYFSSLLRVAGMEDRGWDPYQESRKTLSDLASIINFNNFDDELEKSNHMALRLCLIYYSLAIEMNAPYEVILNLLRFQQNEGYSINPFRDSISNNEMKKYRNGIIPTYRKIEIIQEKASIQGLNTDSVFLDFFRPDIRNAIFHSDYIIHEGRLRFQDQRAGQYVEIESDTLNDLILRTRCFYETYFFIENKARELWGTMRDKGWGYDPIYKGVLEVLTDNFGSMNGFKLHWPNGSTSHYRRAEDGISMVNCRYDNNAKTISFFVGQYARNKGRFSPLVEEGRLPVYGKTEISGQQIAWNP